MTVKLELMEYVWLQNINRNPFKYHYGDLNVVPKLLETGLVERGSPVAGGNLVITTLGKEIMRAHSPWLWNESLETFERTPKKKTRKISYH